MRPFRIIGDTIEFDGVAVADFRSWKTVPATILDAARSAIEDFDEVEDLRDKVLELQDKIDRLEATDE